MSEITPKEDITKLLSTCKTVKMLRQRNCRQAVDELGDVNFIALLGNSSQR